MSGHTVVMALGLWNLSALSAQWILLTASCQFRSIELMAYCMKRQTGMIYLSSHPWESYSLVFFYFILLSIPALNAWCERDFQQDSFVTCFKYTSTLLSNRLVVFPLNKVIINFFVISKEICWILPLLMNLAWRLPWWNQT